MLQTIDKQTMAHKKTNKKPRKQASKKSDKGNKQVRGRGKSQVSERVQGVLEVVKNGNGFLSSDKFEQDIWIRKDDLNWAMNGDVVVVEVRSLSSKGRPEGAVKSILKHKQSEFSGRVKMSKNFAFLLPDQINMPVDIYLPLVALNGAQEGDRVLVHVTQWGMENKKPMGKVVEIMNDQRENDIAMKSILVENGFPLHFSEEAMQEADALPETLDPVEISKRKDCREVLTMTIDPQDAKDFDDAISIRQLKSGAYEVGVHIADVSHYVLQGSQLDREAYERATSVYLPDRVLPMLPEHISNVLCSLRPNEDKFTFSAIFQIDETLKVKQYWLGRTVIHSDRRFSYEEVQDVIEGADDPYKEQLLWLNGLAQKLRKERFKNGAINFSSQEVRFKLDDKGVPIGVEIKESKAAHQLIEELMLLANRTVAGYVSKKKVDKQEVPFPYRVHDVPNEEKLGVFAAFAARFGYKFDLKDADKVAKSFNSMLESVKGKPEQHVLEQLGIRTMAKALYRTDNIGHYGLGFDQYCHFTSPIRRYPDIMVHRIVQQCLDNSIQKDKDMESKCVHCSDQEKKAMEAERSATKYKQVEYMSKFLGDSFDAVVSGISSFGFWAETIEQKCEGLISIADLSRIDEFHFIEADYALVGMRTGKRFGIGDKVRVQVAAASLERRQIDFVYVPDAPEKATKKTAKDPAKAPKKSAPAKKKSTKKGKG